MDYLDDLGNLALGSRLKRLSERLAQEVAQVYKLQGIEFEPRWFPVFRYLAETNSASITDIASAVGVTHPAVNQISEELAEKGLVVSVTDGGDKRRRMLSLSAKGKALKEQLNSVWKVLHASLSDVNEEIQNDLVNASLCFEKALDSKSLVNRFDSLKETVLHCQPEIVEYAPELAHHFARLNRVWIEKYFRLEQEDLRILGDPQKIIDDGGYIYFATIGQKVIGTCALFKLEDGAFEVVKMAVDEAYRSGGLGRRLMETCIEKAAQEGASEVLLETNSVLKSAVRLYRKLGFQEVKPRHETKFSRVDLVMALDLKSRTRPNLETKVAAAVEN